MRMCVRICTSGGSQQQDGINMYAYVGACMGGCGWVERIVFVGGPNEGV